MTPTLIWIKAAPSGLDSNKGSHCARLCILYPVLGYSLKANKGKRGEIR